MTKSPVPPVIPADQSQPKTGHRTKTAPTDVAMAPATVTPSAPRPKKTALLRERLAAPGGVTLTALMLATGWQAHTVRAALTGLRKTGLAVTRWRDGANTIYGVGTSEAAPAPPATAAPNTGAGAAVA